MGQKLAALTMPLLRVVGFSPTLLDSTCCYAKPCPEPVLAPERSAAFCTNPPLIPASHRKRDTFQTTPHPHPTLTLTSHLITNGKRSDTPYIVPVTDGVATMVFLRSVFEEKCIRFLLDIHTLCTGAYMGAHPCISTAHAQSMEFPRMQFPCPSPICFPKHAKQH